MSYKDLTSKNISKIEGINNILDTSTTDDLLAFIKNQINNPFDSGDINYFKKLRQVADSRDALDRYCLTILRFIEDRYPGLSINVPEGESLAHFTNTIYKFFGKNMKKLVTEFMIEYIMNNKNRKAIIDAFSTIKVQNYSKEMYGKKDYYILITRMDSIVKYIADLRLSFDDMLHYLTRGEDVPPYLIYLSEMLRNDDIGDDGLYTDIMEIMIDSDDYASRLATKMCMKVQNAIIHPYLKSIGCDDALLNTIFMNQFDQDEDDADTDSDDFTDGKELNHDLNNMEDDEEAEENLGVQGINSFIGNLATTIRMGM